MSFGPHVSRYHAPGARASIVAHIEAARREAEVDADFAIAAAAIFVGGPKNKLLFFNSSIFGSYATSFR